MNIQNRLKALAIISLAALSMSSESYANELLTADKIVEKANNVAYYSGKDGRSDARMTIVDANGTKQYRQFSIIRKNEMENEIGSKTENNEAGQNPTGNQDFLVVFSRPKNVKNTAFLVEKNVSDADNRWLYLPALDLVKRIADGDKRTSFVGSDYYYEDVSGRELTLDTHELISTEVSTYRIQSTAKDQDSVEFSYYITDINKADFLPRRIEYFNAQGQVIRLVETLEVQDIAGFATVTKAKVSNLQTQSSTTLEFRNVQYNIDVPQSVFSERSMRNPPLEWLKKRK